MAEPLKILPELLLPWFRENARALPWRESRDPYRVWLSEIMLQQTRAETVKEYYRRFLAALPDVFALAEAPEEQLMKLWEGLGYYSRARNLQKAARRVAALGGSFPGSYEGLLALEGVGEYTAGAIASICFEQPAAAVDGNVIRVAARFLADARPVGDPAWKKELKARLEQIYPRGHCGDFTQALMELGATVCLPNGAPLCDRCPLEGCCAAHRAGIERTLPTRPAKKPRRVERKTVFLLRCGELLALEKRPASGLLAGLWQLPNLEGWLSPQEAAEKAAEWGLQPMELAAQLHKIHIFTHVRWEMVGYELFCARTAEPFLWTTQTQRLRDYALPTAFRQFLEKK